MFRDITAPYHVLESWIYDYAVAPAVTGMIEERSLLGPIIDSLPRDGRLLDVGCGGGHMAFALAAQYPELRITGADQSPEQIRRAEIRSRRTADRLRFITASALDLPFESGSFDGLTSLCSIKHWQDPARGLNECIRVLRPGSRLAIIEVDPDHDPEDRIAFVARQRVPGCLRWIAMAGFRWMVAARSLSLLKAESLFKALPVTAMQAFRVPGMPMWIIIARKK